MHIQIQSLELNAPTDLARALTKAGNDEALLVVGDPVTFDHRAAIAQAALAGTEKGTMKFYCKPDDACKCARDPSTPECKAKYGTQLPPINFLLDTAQTSWSGELHLSQRTVPLPTAIPQGPFSRFREAPVLFKKADKPCDPNKLGD